MAARAEIVVDGDVQGVGFRYYVRREARRLGITGYVENLEDGTVKVVGEAGEETLKQLVEKIKAAPPPARVVSLQLRYGKPTGEFKTFKIKVGELAEELVEGFSTGAAYFEIMFGKQDQMLAKQDIMIGKQDEMLKKQDIMIAKQDIMIAKQDLMLAKQDEMLKKQDVMISKQDEMLKKQDQMLAKQDIMIGKQDEMLKKQDIMIAKQDEMLVKQDEMLKKQDVLIGGQDTMMGKIDVLIGEVSGLRRDLRSLFEERIVRIERDIAEIKARLGIGV
ncbi:Acylphosphatase [archaeon HR01]|nr:Acylphosphatase [archaeon HR01]